MEKQKQRTVDRTEQYALSVVVLTLETAGGSTVREARCPQVVFGWAASRQRVSVTEAGYPTAHCVPACLNTIYRATLMVDFDNFESVYGTK